MVCPYLKVFDAFNDVCSLCFEDKENCPLHKDVCWHSDECYTVRESKLKEEP